MNNEKLNFQQTLEYARKKGIDKQQVIDSIISGELPTYLINPETKKLQLFKITFIDEETREVGGYFLNS